MDKDFWIDRWETNKTKFNQAAPNPALIKYFDQLSLKPGGTIFVPLCGKSIDMLWLMNQELNIIGVELSERACNDFFKENQLMYKKKIIDGFTVYSHENITIYCGDYFKLSNTLIGKQDAFYDRASLIALPPKMRAAYVNQLANLMPAESKGLLLTIIYNTDEMDGPPFSTPDSVIDHYYINSFNINRVENKKGTVSPHLAEKGLKEAYESIFLFEKLT